MRILIPLPRYGFDPTESAVPWKILSQQGHDIIFSTPDGTPAAADVRMVSGKGLGVWKAVLQARADAVETYMEMSGSSSFQHPIHYHQISPDMGDALLLPGGHDKGMREYLNSPQLQALASYFLTANKPVAAICHGVVLLARSKNPMGQSVLMDYRTTALLKMQELAAFQMTRLWLGDYYRTYPETVEDEVKSNLRRPDQFISGPIPLGRDTLQRPSGFTIRDRNYLSARWPGDVYAFAMHFGQMLS
ncbi:MAG TPA: type 1 glutamine amidotransferase domain-containing protein [Cyclobacteriaceae bacterium]|nr:type 1 glutamine amidotransferase domain-containing protein [Cyclobacteriaceae bacterium]